MKVILADHNEKRFYPLCFTRPVGMLRVGIQTIREKWEYFGAEVSFQTRPSLQGKFGEVSKDSIWVDASFIPDRDLLLAISDLKAGEKLCTEDQLIAFHPKNGEEHIDQVADFQSKTYEKPLISIERLQDLFLSADKFITDDYINITRNRASQILPEDNQLIGPLENLFIEEGARVQASIINVSNGPVYIGKNAEIMEGSLIRGPFALGEGAVLKMGAKIYGPTVIGPYCKVGGEVSNSVFHGYSNKAHDGFVGNSVLGEWCNLGADTNTSNLKNNYGSVKIWDYSREEYSDSGLTFCGLLMGDHSKCSINTMFNTGTTVGVNANIFGGGFPPKFIPSFIWGGSDGFDTYNIDRAAQVAKTVYARRGVKFADEDRALLEAVLTETAHFRS